VLAHGSSEQQAAFMHIATSSIQCCWQLQLDGSTRKVQPLWCAACNATLTLRHLAVCAANTSFRDVQRHAILATLAVYADDWQKMHAHLPLDQLLVKLFPKPAATALHLHVTHTMCGVFSARQANAACKMLGVVKAQDARHLMQQLRLCCVDGVRAFLSALKQALP
jgi:hypothetical protein